MTLKANSNRADERSTPRVSSLFAVVLALFAAAIGYWIWLEREERSLPDGIAVSTGVMTATQVPVASATGGAVAAVLVQPGSAVTAGTALLRLRSTGGDVLVGAPRGGRLDRVTVEVGAEIEPGRVVAMLTDLADLTMIAPFPAEIAQAVPLGAEARVLLTAFRDRPILGRVSSVRQPDGGAEAAGQTGRMATIAVEVTDTRSLALEAGQRGRVYVRYREGAPWPARIR